MVIKVKVFFRKTIYKVKPLYSLCIKYVYFKNKRFYAELRKQNKTIEELNLKNSFSGKRCFIVGNGPSLITSDLEKIINEDCFAANLIFKIFDKTKWRPKFYFVQDRYAKTEKFLEKCNVEKIFIGDYYWRTRMPKNSNAYCFHTERIMDADAMQFSDNVYKCIYDGGTITYTMLQMAMFMGYTEIYLLGIDHNYSRTIDKNRKISINNSLRSHFFDDENPKEVIANIEMMEKAYQKAYEYACKNNIKIYNATRGGNLEVFERKNLDSFVK